MFGFVLAWSFRFAAIQIFVPATILFPYSDILIWPTCETPSSWSDAGAGAFAQSRNVGSQSEMWTLKFWSWYYHNSGHTQLLISDGKFVSTAHQMVQLPSSLHPLPTKIQSNGRHPHLQPTIETLPWAQRTWKFSAFANTTSTPGKTSRFQAVTKPSNYITISVSVSYQQW